MCHGCCKVLQVDGTWLLIVLLYIFALQCSRRLCLPGWLVTAQLLCTREHGMHTRHQGPGLHAIAAGATHAWQVSRSTKSKEGLYPTCHMQACLALAAHNPDPCERWFANMTAGTVNKVDCSGC